MSGLLPDQAGNAGLEIKHKAAVHLVRGKRVLRYAGADAYSEAVSALAVTCFCLDQNAFGIQPRLEMDNLLPDLTADAVHRLLAALASAEVADAEAEDGIDDVRIIPELIRAGTGAGIENKADIVQDLLLQVLQVRQILQALP